MPFDLNGVTKNFFNSKLVTDQVPAAERKALSKFGAFVRTRDRSSLKYATKSGNQTSAPGKPPLVHRRGFKRKKTNKKTGITTTQSVSPLRELIFFAYDPTNKSVVIGPVAFGSKAASTIEQGGDAVVTKDGRRAKVHVRPRPHTRPAFVAELAKVDGDFRNIIK